MRHIAVADIGGTNCRFALFGADPDLCLLSAARCATKDLHDIEDVLDALEASGLGLDVAEADMLVIALAGPVHKACGQTSNASLYVDLSAINPKRGIRQARLLNDFAAQAYACLVEPGRNARLIQGGEAEPGAPKGVIGGGTGFGGAVLIPDSAGRWIILPTEIGHTAFPFAGEEETGFAAFVCRELGLDFARGDDVLTGRGLSLLHHFLEGRALTPQEVSANCLQQDSPVLRWFASFYGRMCRNWILTTLCRGGLFISGGIAVKNPLIFTHPAFAAELHAGSGHGEMLRAIPVRLLGDENSGLWGAALAGRQFLQAAARRDV